MNTTIILVILTFAAVASAPAVGFWWTALIAVGTWTAVSFLLDLLLLMVQHDELDVEEE